MSASLVSRQCPCPLGSGSTAIENTESARRSLTDVTNNMAIGADRSLIAVGSKSSISAATGYDSFGKYTDLVWISPITRVSFRDGQYVKKERGLCNKSLLIRMIPA